MGVEWIVIFSLLGLFLFLPIIWNARLIRFLATYRSTAQSERPLPRAAILLPLRGADPSLRGCLAGLLRQDYPHYSLHIIIDSHQDPAWEVVQGILAQGPGNATEVRVEVLE